MADVRLTKRANKLLSELPDDIQERVKSDLRDAGEDPILELNSLSGWNYHSVRTGDYRSLVDWDRENEILWVFAVGHRRNVYDRYLPP